jgi:uncharacterized protein YbdZ (MbtH family)
MFLARDSEQFSYWKSYDSLEGGFFVFQQRTVKITIIQMVETPVLGHEK